MQKKSGFDYHTLPEIYSSKATSAEGLKRALLKRSRAVPVNSTGSPAAWQQTVPAFSALFPFFSDSSTEFWDTDIKWFSLLESSSWLDIIRYFKALFCS